MPLAPPVPVTWTAGQTPQYTDFNTSIRDAFTYLTAKTVFRAWQSTVQSIPASTQTLLSLQTVTEDTYSGWNAVSNEYVAQETGLYLITGCYYSAPGTSGTGKIQQLLINAMGNLQAAGTVPIPSGPSGGVQGSILVYLSAAAGDFVQLYAFQNSGAALNTQATIINASSSMEILWCGS